MTSMLAQVPGKKDCIVICPLSEEQKAVYQRVVDHPVIVFAVFLFYRMD